MMRWFCAVTCGAFLAIAGCGSSSSGDGSAAVSSGDGAAGETVCVTVQDADKLAWTGSAAPTYTCDAQPSAKNPDGGNACRNASDCAIIASGMVREITRVCMLSCR